MWAAIFGLVGVIVGGVLGTAGLWLIEARKEKGERKKRRAEKLEELVAAIYEHRHWLDVVENQRVFGSTDPKPMSPFAKIEAVATVHFQNFLPRISELEYVARAYELWMFNAAKKRLGTGSISCEGHAEAYKPYLEKVQDLLKDIQTYSKTEFQ